MNGKMPGDDLYMGKGLGRGVSFNDKVQKGYPECVMFERLFKMEIQNLDCDDQVGETKVFRYLLCLLLLKI